MDRIVPWDNTDREAERGVSDNCFLFIVLRDHFLLQFDVGKLSQPMDTSLDLCQSKMNLSRQELDLHNYGQRPSHRFALLLGEQLRKALGMLLNAVGVCQDGLLTFFVCGL